MKDNEEVVEVALKYIKLQILVDRIRLTKVKS
jgi:hypothetical protein